MCLRWAKQTSKETFFSPQTVAISLMRTVEDITHTHTVHLCVYTQCICVCCDHYRTRAYGGQEQWSNSRTWRTGASVWTRTPTYQHAHAHLRSRARGVGNKWEYVAESTVLTCSVSQGGVGKTLILTKLQGRSGREIIDNQQVTERG